MKRHIAATFAFPPELGARLRVLRKQAGLRLIELAHLMGRKTGYVTHLSRLENGRLPYPTLAVVADYLRACRASFADIGPVLDRYTGLPPAREPRAREAALAGLAGDGSRDAARLGVYDRKTAEARRAAGQKPVPAVKRAAALSRQLLAAREQRELARVVEEEVGRLGLASSLPARKLALDYGRMVLRALRQTREEGPTTKAQRESGGGGQEKDKHQGHQEHKEGGSGVKVRRRGRPRKTREARLAEAEARMKELGPGILPEPAFERIRARVTEWFAADSRPALPARGARMGV